MGNKKSEPMDLCLCIALLNGKCFPFVKETLYPGIYTLCVNVQLDEVQR